MPSVLSDLIWVQTDCVNVTSRRTVARKLNASCADNKNTIINPLAYNYDCYIVKPCRRWPKLFQKDISKWQNVAGR